jgi:hypothetical protein
MNPQFEGNAHRDGGGILRFQTNIWAEVALQYPEGREVEGQYGPQMLCTLVDGRKMYIPPMVAARIRELGIQPREPFQIGKIERREGAAKKLVWEVKRVYAPGQAPAAPSAVSAAHGTGDRSQEAVRGTNIQQASTPAPRPEAPRAAAVAAAPARVDYETALTQFIVMATRAASKAEKELSAEGLAVRFDSEKVGDWVSTLFIQASREGHLIPWVAATAAAKEGK